MGITVVLLICAIADLYMAITNFMSGNILQGSISAIITVWVIVCMVLRLVKYLK